MICPSSSLEEAKAGKESSGVMDSDEGLSHSLIEGNKERIQQGVLLDASLNQGIYAFNPEMMFENLVKDFSNAEKIYGESMLRASTGFDSKTLKKNIRFPEFQRELKKKLKQAEAALKDEGFVDDQGIISERGFNLASAVLYMHELDDLRTKGLGERKSKKVMIYGERENTRGYRRHDRYRDIALKSSIRKALRRGHDKLTSDDLMVFERDDRGKIYVVYCLDASGSMKGKKIDLCKRAGVALAYKAIEEMDRVGLVIFGDKIEDFVHPTNDFSQFVRAITRIKAKKQTDIALTIERAIEIFPKENVTKHMVLITDAAPNVGDDPDKNTLNLVERAANLGITISLIGIELGDDGLELAKKIVDIGKGRLYIVKDLENLDRIVLQDYYNI